MRVTRSELKRIQGKLALDPGPAQNTVAAPLEHDEQAALMEIIHAHERKYPELLNLTAIPLGGFRAKRTAAILAREGVRAGYPDILLDVARGGYHGLRVEMKRIGNKPTPLQLEWHRRLAREGYAVVVCYSAADAWETILRYLDSENE